jgi:hypothetical protein
MAGDWIKMRTDLHNDPAVIVMADTLNVSDNEVVGLLLKFWSWATNQLTDGVMTGITESWLDRYVGKKGFTKSLEKVKWLEKNGDVLVIPKWEHHLSKGAKNRSLGAKRQETFKKVTQGALPTGNAGTVTREEKRREEEKREEVKPQNQTPLPPTGGLLPGMVDDDQPTRRRRTPQPAVPVTLNPDELSPHFNTFWKYYPRKEKKMAAWQTWQRDGMEEHGQKIIDAVRAYRQSEAWTKDEGKYVPHPTTFLNQRMYLDTPKKSMDIYKIPGT